MSQLHVLVDIPLPKEAMELLRNGLSDYDSVLLQSSTQSSRAAEDRKARLAETDVIFGQPGPEVVDLAGRLKWIHVSSAGITRYDNPGFWKLLDGRKIVLTNSSAVFAEPCAVHALAFMLAQARKLPAALETRAAAETEPWQAVRGFSRTLRGETVLIFGYGAIGRRFAELLRPFEIRVLAYRRRVKGDENVPVITPDQLAHTLSTEADHVINILPESSETRHFFDAARFSAFKPGAVFYNIGRGATVDQDALLDALRSGQIRAAWLDVTEPEPLPDGHPLLSEPNCFITPHVAGGHPDEAKSLVRHFLNNLGRFIDGETLLDRVR